ncbi:tetrapyrrole (Corrin/Porphyrin) Methylases family protein [Mycobacteroides abscessus subsp. bolletii 1513]|uniref:Tetrapyrrole (Corrin/Porphyrin) Methylases family protein n=1 Tax=Mycobacteroides abscessus subsp. bolletii 1513 TaxID=1299321 RepID=X8DHU1_9MYCO|nr:tetrapyrrole (Corrin/Porphyrin) Methylases family protein [Mycobacteroides abscessus subsp. bolletii 1513]
MGDPADVAKTLVAEARSGVDVVRLVAGDPLSIDSVLAEVHAVTRTQVAFEILPGLASSTAVPAYAGLPRARPTPWPMCAATWIGRPWPLLLAR